MQKGDIRNSMAGSSANVANVMAAMFIATGPLKLNAIMAENEADAQ